MKVELSELLDALDFVSFNGGGESTAYICKETGRIYCHSDWTDDVEPLPDDIEDNPNYIAIPDKRALDLGSRLPLEFALHHLPDDYDEVRQIFKRAGAYARFKDPLERRHALDQWYAFEKKATEEALAAWCNDNGFEIGDAPQSGAIA